MATNRDPDSRSGYRFAALLGSLLAAVGGGLAWASAQSDRQDITCGYNPYSFGCHTFTSIGLNLLGMGLIMLAMTAWYARRRGD